MLAFCYVCLILKYIIYVFALQKHFFASKDLLYLVCPCFSVEKGSSGGLGEVERSHIPSNHEREAQQFRNWSNKEKVDISLSLSTLGLLNHVSSLIFK